MNKIKISLLVTGCILALTSCNKYLDVQPVDKMIDQQVFSSASSIQKALNGIYIKMVAEELYGGNLTATTVDVMAQYYNFPGVHRFASASKYKYTDGSLFQKDISNIWGSAFTLILNINQFIAGVKNVSTSVLTTQEKEWMLGEAYGLRAYVAFDIFRLFGPVYSTGSTTAVLPYPELPETKLGELLPPARFMDLLLRDCSTALELLQQDPIIQLGVQPFDTEDISANFFKARNRRMNYYAVKTLQARIQLYMGDKENALKTALEVINIASNKFPWTPETDTRSNISNPDRVFSREILFGPENPLRNLLFQSYFGASNYLQSGSGDPNSNTLLAPLASRLNEFYENQENDFRLRSSWAIDRTANYNFKVFTKFTPLTASNAGVFPAFRNIQPLMRISELFYIAAECTPDKQQAATYLNEVRSNRGILNPLSATDNITNEITKEYRKEFWGEGQLFFYYKRNNFASIPAGSSANSNITMTSGLYMIPLPLSETQYR
ncbi:MAG: RagB/SusD family nutrient uptake outer membrane protein [Pseudobacter sp.]|uniref:RagB/SusD family nutrient uptake outer membrane protein n=1 Tax=Pseudobacter sp. TaxID=2045420 RepID=UPI003F7FAB8D